MGENDVWLLSIGSHDLDSRGSGGGGRHDSVRGGEEAKVEFGGGGVLDGDGD
jgi:hypothetical protein